MIETSNSLLFLPAAFLRALVQQVPIVRLLNRPFYYGCQVDWNDRWLRDRAKSSQKTLNVVAQLHTNGKWCTDWQQNVVYGRLVDIYAQNPALSQHRRMLLTEICTVTPDSTTPPVTQWTGPLNLLPVSRHQAESYLKGRHPGSFVLRTSSLGTELIFAAPIINDYQISWEVPRGHPVAVASYITAIGRCEHILFTRIVTDESEITTNSSGDWQYRTRYRIFPVYPINTSPTSYTVSPESLEKDFFYGLRPTPDITSLVKALIKNRLKFPEDACLYDCTASWVLDNTNGIW